MESLVHYSNPAHGVSLLGVLNEQRLKGQLCDVVLVVGDQRYQAHRSVLAASSEYFQSLFTRSDPDPCAAVQLDFCEPEAFEIVLNYIYSSSLFMDKCSLAAIQELGYSLGIPFLTNIMSTRPQVSYCVSRKRMSFSEEDDSSYQQRSVIVRQGCGDPPGPGAFHRRGSNHQGKALKQVPSMGSEEIAQAHLVRAQGRSSGHSKPMKTETERHAVSIHRTFTQPTGDHEPKSTSHNPASILKGRAASVRPQLTSSVSFSESDIQHTSSQSDRTGDTIDEQLEPLYDSKPALPGERNQTIDRSGPLIKSLLRRSLSMDSPVPVFSPVLELKDSQNREQSVVKMVTKTTGSQSVERKHQGSKGVPPLILRSRHHNMYEKDDIQGAEVHVKTEPSSPLADPSDIIRITVGDNLPVNLKDLQMNYDEGPRGYFNHSVKRKARMDGSSNPFKKSRVSKEHHFTHEDREPAEAPHNSNMEDRRAWRTEEPGELRPNKMFKCWNCLKVFRSNAGLYRHVNMYHNPEKPYACDICHKRFHTNFKVWTHCQTQHGVVQNPAPSSSSYSVLDEKFQRKLIDIVREREIKKALIMKLRRNKQGLQSQGFGKKNLRSRSTYGCPYCGKMFWFQSQFKQHLKMHPPEKANLDADRESDLLEKRDQMAHLKENQDQEVYPCRLCNEKLSSPLEQGDHERGCRHATVCPYCGLRFSSTLVKKDHEAHCKYKKLTCLECMRTFKSSFSIWRHQVEVHNHNMMTVKEQLSLSRQENNGEAADPLRAAPPSQEPRGAGDSREDPVYSDSLAPPTFDSEDSSSYVPEDLSVSHHRGELQVKEEPEEEAVADRENAAAAADGSEEPGVWPCEKCGKLFSTHKDLERHQELLCHIKPFICHICHKAFRTNFRLWSHFQSHMSTPDEAGARELDRRPSSPSPSPPPATPVTGPPPPQGSPPETPQAATAAEAALEQEPGGSSSMTKHKRPEPDKPDNGDLSLPKTDSTDKPLTPQESDTLFYHAPTLSALTFKRQYMCKLCHRTFKTAFSLWSHEQSHSHL